MGPEFSWEEWFTALKVVFWLRTGTRYNDHGYDYEAFYDMYEDGLTPSEAFSEELYAASTML